MTRPARHAHWRDHALCARPEYAHVDWFNESPNRRAREATEEVAKAVCASCPVRQACLDDALESYEQYGVRGELTAPERRKLRRYKGRAS